MRKPIIIGAVTAVVAAALGGTALASQMHRHAGRHVTPSAHVSTTFRLPASTPAQENAAPVTMDSNGDTTTPDQPDAQQGDQSSLDQSGDPNDSQDQGDTNDSQDQGDSNDSQGDSNDSQDQGGGSQGDQSGSQGDQSGGSQGDQSRGND